MRRSWVGAVLALLALTAGCGNRPSQQADPIAVAAGSALDPVVETTTTTTAAPPPSTTTTTTARPATTTTTTTKPATTRTTAAPAPARYAPPPPPPGVVADGVGGYGGVATTTDPDATVALSLYPREQYFGEMVQVHVSVTTKEFVSVKIDMGNGTVFDAVTPRGGQCTTEARDVSTSAPYYVYPAPGQYVIRAVVTVTPCIPIPGPPGSPPGAPSPTDHHSVVATIGLNQRADPPPRPVGPPPGA